jgi:AcrR family transcriptional regulator
MPVRAPLQARSQRTLDAILDATEELLEQYRFEQLPLARIILKAGVSNGSFYARFSGKDALLPALYQRYNADMPDRIAQLRRRLSGNSSLAEACASLIDAFAFFFSGRRNLMRAMVIYSRTRSDEVRPLLGERSGIHQQTVDLFRPFHGEIGGERPEERVRAGLFIAVAGLREAILFPDAPMAAVTGQDEDALRRAAAEMLFAYLTRKEAGR